MSIKQFRDKKAENKCGSNFGTKVNKSKIFKGSKGGSIRMGGGI